MKRLISTGLAFCAMLLLNAQDNNPLINSGKLINEGSALHDQGKYKEAINIYQKISRADTNYYLALYETAFSQYLDSQFVAARHSCEAGLAEENDQKPHFFSLYGNLTDDMGNTERSIRIYDSAIALYPASTDLYLNKGTSLIKLHRYADAENVFKQCILINPYQASSHYKLGVCALQQGKIIQAFLCYINYLLLQPSGRFKGNCITAMSSISNSKDEILELIQKRTADPGEGFAIVEKIVLSKMALNKQYKPILKLDDAISRQIQVIFEKLEYDENDPDFWMQYYVPLFKNIFNDHKFEPFINRIFADVNVDDIKEYTKKNKKEIDNVVADVVSYYNQLRATREVNYATRKGMETQYQYDDDRFYGKGHLKNNGETNVGDWEYYYSSGNLRSKGSYNEKGEKIGPWEYYYFNGRLRGKQTYTNGVQEGTEIFYFDNGLTSSEAIFKNGLEEGESKSYYKIGLLHTIAHFNNGKLNGERKTYFSNGNLSAIENYKEDSLDGPFKTYFNNGALESQGTYNNSKLDGEYKSYHQNGKLSMEGPYSNGKPKGVWKEYHDNGKLKMQETFVNGLTDGEYIEYYDNGQLFYKSVYKNGKANGDVEYFDKDGKRFSLLSFDNDIMKGARYFDKSGKETGFSERKSKTFNLTSYFPDGFKRSTVVYNEKGEMNGPEVFYFKSGKTSSETIYKNGVLDGTETDYYANGNKELTIDYKDGEKNGYQKFWYSHGQLQEEGWFQEGSTQGTWLNYDELGNLSTRTEYLNNELNGYKEDYFPNGKKESEVRFKLGWIQHFVQFDTTGKEINRCTFKNGNGKLLMLLVNGKSYIEGNYVNSDLEGPYKYYFFDGSTNLLQFYKKGNLDSIYRNYYYGGTLYKEGQYNWGKKTGIWKTYYSTGHLNYVENYGEDKLEGKKIFYYEDGKTDEEIELEKGNQQGWTKKYDPDGSLAYQVRFEEDLPVAYTYADRSGKLLPEIPIPGGNGKIKTYFANGNISSEFAYADGKINGSYTLYYSNGKICKQSTQNYNISEGPYKYYYPSGQLRGDYNFLHDNLNGFYKEYSEKGVVTEEGYYYNGLPHNIIKMYDDNGKLKQARHYYFGKLLDITK